MIDWSDPQSPISKHFKVREAVWLPSWSRSATEADGLNDHVKAQIVTLANLMDGVHEFIGIPVIVHCWYRPTAYNAFVKGAESSSHQCLGDYSAIDWSASVESVGSMRESCDVLKAALLPKLAEWGLRMENNGAGAPWIHLDTHPVISSRYFRP